MLIDFEVTFCGLLDEEPHYLLVCDLSNCSLTYFLLTY